jgi:DNA modification methylase
MILTDPPYKMDYKGGGCFQKGTVNIRRRIANIIDFEVQKIAFYRELDIPTLYIFTSKALIKDYLNTFERYNSTILVWCKTNPTPFVNGSFLPDLEYLMYFSKPGKSVWNRGLRPLSLYSRYYISSKEAGKKDDGDLHPTMKPLKMIEDKILISSRQGGTVFDGFGGSGTTLIACEKNGRRCFMMEHEPEYCDTTIKRWEKYTGKTAIKEVIERP